MSNPQGTHRTARTGHRSVTEAPQPYPPYEASGRPDDRLPGRAGSEGRGSEPYAGHGGYAQDGQGAYYEPADAYRDRQGTHWQDGQGTYGQGTYGQDGQGTDRQPAEPYDPAYAVTQPAYGSFAQYPGADEQRYGASGLLPRQQSRFDTLVDPAPVPVPGPPARSAAGVAPAGGRAAARRAARAKRTADGPDVLRRLLPQALVVVFLAGGSTAFVANDKTVQLSVDGAPRTLHTFAGEVGELLEDEGVHVGRHDIVAPAPQEVIEDGDEIAVRHGRPVTLTLDGERRQMWTTASTVEGALRQLGVRAEGAFLSASRHSAISRRGLTLDVRTERTVTFLADGRERTIRTNAATVREAVAAAGIELRGEDTTSVPAGSFPRDGQTVSVMRITGSKKVREVAIPFRTVERADHTLFRGTEVVVRQGRPGVQRVSYGLRSVNGVAQRPRKLGTETVREPVDQIVNIGMKPPPDSVAAADGLNWNALAQCEAGGRPDAVDASGTYGGLYQFDTRTWQSLGGRGRPQDAPAAEQTRLAKKLYVQRGASPWPVCGRKLRG